MTEYEKGCADTRAALAEKVEGMKSESDSLVKDVRNDTLDAVLALLREPKALFLGGGSFVERKEPDASQGCCDKCWLERVPFMVKYPCLTPSCPCHSQESNADGSV